MSLHKHHETSWQFARSKGFEPWQLTGKVYDYGYPTYNYERFTEEFRSAINIHKYLKKQAPNRLLGVRVVNGEAV